MLKNLFAANPKDFVTEVDEKCIILVKEIGEKDGPEELEHFARMIVDNLQSEAMVPARVGYSKPVEQLPDISRAYQEARVALEVGNVFYADKETISYQKLGIGRLIYQLPVNLCEMFLHEVFGENIPQGFDEETLITIQKFFENNLNISETARQLYVHRNTLVYRLERIEKSLGLDIRTFEDAMLFQIAKMVMAHMEYQKKKESPKENRQ
jgi:carbohydrate diacid regulator